MGIGGNWDGRLLSRRRFLGAAGGLAGLLALGSPPAEKAVAAPRFTDYPFKLGVASGDPRPDSVVLWTRLAPEPLAEDGSGGVAPERYDARWEVAADENFRRVVRRGSAAARPGLGHSVHAEVEGLRPGRQYFYRFKAGGEISAVGRTKTVPEFDARLASLAFAFVSCQDWRDGFYAAYKRLAEEDLDFVVHLGDYIYEGGNTDDGVRDHTDGGREVFTLAEYRNRHALYKTDESLQAAHPLSPGWSPGTTTRLTTTTPTRRPTAARTRRRSSGGGRRPTGPTTSTCPSGAPRSPRVLTCACTAGSRGGISSGSACSIPASTARTSLDARATWTASPNVAPKPSPNPRR